MTVTRNTPVGSWPELLRPEEAALVLGISKGLVYSLCQRNELPHLKLGRLLRVKRDGLATMLIGNGNGRQ